MFLDAFRTLIDGVVHGAIKQPMDKRSSVFFFTVELALDFFSERCWIGYSEPVAFVA